MTWGDWETKGTIKAVEKKPWQSSGADIRRITWDAWVVDMGGLGDKGYNQSS